MMTTPQTRHEFACDDIGAFKQAAESAEDIFFIVDEDRSVRFTNGKSRPTTDFSTRGPLDGQVCKGISQALRNTIESVFESGRALSAECCLGKPGSRIWLHNLLTPVPDGSGKVRSILGIARDISEQKHTQRLIADSRSEWLQAVDAMPHLLAVIDSNYRIKKANRALANHLGLRPEDLHGQTCHQIFGIPPRESCPLRGPKSSGCPSASFQANISGQSFLITTSPLADAAGNTTGCLFVAVGLNAYPDDGQSKKKTIEQIKALLARAEYIVTIQDRSGKYLSMKALPGNIEFPQAILGKTPFDFFDSASAARICESAGQAIRTGRDLTVSNELKLGGETFYLLDHISPVNDESGNVSLVVSISKRIERASKSSGPITNESRGLSRRELEVLQLIGSGFTTSQIAEKLFISRKTVETHRSRIMQKLGLHKSPALVQYAVKSGMF